MEQEIFVQYQLCSDQDQLIKTSSILCLSGDGQNSITAEFYTATE